MEPSAVCETNIIMNIIMPSLFDHMLSGISNPARNGCLLESLDSVAWFW